MATCCLLHLKEIGTCKVPFAGGHVVLDELIVVQCVLGLFGQVLAFDRVAVAVQICCGRVGGEPVCVQLVVAGLVTMIFRV